MPRTRLFLSLATEIVESAAAKGVKIATAESCTGGLISAALTDIPGSSAVFERGFITYSNEAKCQMLGVDQDLIDRYGAVSPAVAQAMAVGALTFSQADLSISVTGVAGPDGGSPEKPIGLVWFGMASRESNATIERRLFPHGSRDFVRSKATETALRLIKAAVYGLARHRP